MSLPSQIDSLINTMRTISPTPATSESKEALKVKYKHVKKKPRNHKKTLKKIKHIYIPRPGAEDDDDHECEVSSSEYTRTRWHRYFEKDELCYWYQPTIELGRGQSGIVFQGTVLTTSGCFPIGTTVAIKKFRRVHLIEQVKRLLKELKILRSLRTHNNILKIYDIIPPIKKEWNTLSVILEYFPADLSQIFRTNQFFTTFDTQKILYQILLGVQHMHSLNIAHCHLEPKSIAIDEKCTIKIQKFDKACYFDRNDHELLSIKCQKRLKPDKESAYDEYKRKLREIDESDLNEELKQFEKRKLRKAYKRNLLKKKFKKKRPIRRRFLTHHWYWSPESVLIETKPSTLEASDIWSIGAIFAELLQMERENRPDPTKRGPIFPGDCYDSSYLNNQIELIFDMIGSPTKDEIVNIYNEKARKCLLNLPIRKKRNLKRCFPGSTKRTLDLLTQFLKFNVDERIKMEKALNHPYFNQIVKDEIPFGMNKTIEPLFENILQLDMEMDEMKKMILEQVLEYNKDGHGKCMLFAALCEFKIDIVLDGYIRQCIEPLLDKKYVIPIEVLKICYAYMNV